MDAHNLFNKYDPSLQYNSIFWYSQFPTISSNSDKCDSRNENIAKKFASSFIILFTYFFVFFTFPISGWFVLKKIKSLERCLVHRLGKRLPLKGPGFVLILPWIDTFNTIDLDKKVFLVLEDEPILTSDGSLVEVQYFKVNLSISNVIKSITEIKDSQSNVKKFVKISFKNLIYSVHVDDLERKLDILIVNFINNMNLILCNWGWSISSNELPKIIIKSKAEPKNQVLNLLKNYFDPKDQNQNFSQSFENLKKTLFGLTNASFSLDTELIENENKNQQENDKENPNIEKDEIIENLEKLAKRYIHMNIFNYKTFNIHIRINGESTFYVYNTKNNIAHKTDKIENDTIHFTINCKTLKDFQLFLYNNDTSRIEITTKLF